MQTFFALQFFQLHLACRCVSVPAPGLGMCTVAPGAASRERTDLLHICLRCAQHRRQRLDVASVRRGTVGTLGFLLQARKYRSVIDQHVNSAELCNRSGCHGFNRCLLANIERDSSGSSAC
jgi:hypothetical protein